MQDLYELFVWLTNCVTDHRKQKHRLFTDTTLHKSDRGHLYNNNIVIFAPASLSHRVRERG